MRLIDWDTKPDYQPLDRGPAFVQYHEDGDKVAWHNPFDWHWAFWNYLNWYAINRSDDAQAMLLMGGEL